MGPGLVGHQEVIHNANGGSNPPNHLEINDFAEVASQGSPDWNRVEEWLQNMKTLQASLAAGSIE